MTNQLDVKAIRAMCDKATPGPWEVHEALGDFYVIDADGQNVACFAEVYPECAVSLDEHDAAIIAQSRTLIPQLCDEVERLRLRNGALHRRAQTAESALPDWEKIKNRPGRGSVSRALMAATAARLADENSRLRAELDALKSQSA